MTKSKVLVKTYEFQGVKVSQGELTLKKDIEIAKLVKRLSGVDFEDFEAVLNALIEQGLLGDFLDVILTCEGEVDYMELTNSELEVIFSDFLSLNGSVIGRLRGLLQSITIPGESGEKEPGAS